MSTMYHLTTFLVAALTFVSAGVFAQTTTTLSYDDNYGNADLSLNNVACSDGPNGLETKYNITTLGQVPGFPNVGGVETVSGWNSPNCGACYAVTYGSTTVNIIAVDKSTTGFTVSPAAMDALTGGQAVQDGRVTVTYSPC
ncbi:allergenic cerato-platanin Asp F13 [Imleria badia]|nr:allergenic cerato-platanin Asp F13 [Imleria badia]